jgi:hypothetical protein
MSMMLLTSVESFALPSRALRFVDLNYSAHAKRGECMRHKDDSA